jgi:hypothetical protein
VSVAYCLEDRERAPPGLVEGRWAEGERARGGQLAREQLAPGIAAELGVARARAGQAVEQLADRVMVGVGVSRTSRVARCSPKAASVRIARSSRPCAISAPRLATSESRTTRRSASSSPASA